MTRNLYFDCFTGIAGDMTCAALLSLSGAERELRKALKGLPLSGYAFKVDRATSCGIAGLRVDVNVSGKKAHARHLPEIVDLLRKSALPTGAKGRAERAFDLLGEAEAAVHGTTKEKVHFHEVGADDAIVDIASGCFLFDLLGNPEAFCSALPGGSGEAWSEHGRIPVPGPATLALMTGAKWRLGEGEGELVTPTGAALLRAFDASFEKPPEMTVTRTGYGLGHKELPGRPNCLRVIEGQATFDPALQPTYGAPPRTRARISSTRPLSCSVLSRRKVFPPPTTIASAFRTAALGERARSIRSTSYPISRSRGATIPSA